MVFYELQWWHVKKMQWETWQTYTDRMLALDQYHHLQKKKTIWRINEVV